MAWLKRWRKRLRALARKEEVERELDEELALHLELETAKNVAAGMSPQEARRRATITFGGVEKYKEEVRDARTLGWIPGMSLDLKLGIRMLARTPGLTAVGVIGMAVGIAISASVFSFLGSVLGRSLPMEEGDRVVAITNVDVATSQDATETHLHDLAIWREELTTVAELGAYRQATRNLLGESRGEPLSVAEMTASGFRIARTPPHLGRYLLEGDERAGAPAVVVIGYDVWRERFDGRKDILGRTLRMSTGTHEIVGVMPPGFAFPINDEAWVPLQLDPFDFEAGEAPPIRVFGRLSEGASLRQAQGQIAAIGRRLAAAQPTTHEHLRPTVTYYTGVFVDEPPLRIALQSARFLVGIILLVIALNVAILVYARTASRVGEIGVRIALGASRSRVVSQFFAEALVLSGAAAVVGLVAAAAVLQRLELAARGLTMEGLPYWIDFTLSASTIVYVSALTLLAATVAGVLPALKATNRRMQEALRQFGGATEMRMGRTWTVLIAVQAGIAVALLPLGAATQMQLFRGTRTLATSPEMEQVITASIGMEAPMAGSNADGDQGDAEAWFADRRSELLRRLEAEPSIDAVSFASDVPGGGMSQRWLEVEGTDSTAAPTRHPANSYEIGPGLFELYRARILAGRPLAGTGGATANNAAIVSRSFVGSVLGGGNALGRRFRYATNDGDEPGGIAAGEWYEVVGVVSDFPQGASVNPREDASVYHPVAPGRLSTGMTLLLRARDGSAGSAAARVWSVTSDLDPALQVSSVRSAAETARIGHGGAYLMLGGLGALLSAVVLLSAAGVHALVAFTVAQRRREIGVRVALGARPGQVVVGILARAARQIALGLGLGALAAAMLIPAVSATPGRAVQLTAVVAALLLIVALLSALLPARRGLRIQPMEALRQE